MRVQLGVDFMPPFYCMARAHPDCFIAFFRRYLLDRYVHISLKRSDLKIFLINFEFGCPKNLLKSTIYFIGDIGY